MMTDSSRIWREFTQGLEESLKEWENGTTESQSVFQQLQALTKMVLEEDVRSTIPRDVLVSLLEIMRKKEGEGSSLLIVECLRTIRNTAGQNWFLWQETWAQIIKESSSFIQNNGHGNLLITQIALQAMSNTSNSQPSSSNLIWENLQTAFRELLSHDDDKVHLYASSVLYSLLRNSSSIRQAFILDEKNHHLIPIVVFSSHKGVLYSQFVIQLYMKEPGALKILYESLSTLDDKLRLLHQISEFLPACPVDSTNWPFFIGLFNERADIILTTCETPGMDPRALEATGLTEILAKGSGDESSRDVFLTGNLLDVAIELLRAVHSLGKSGSNYFSTVPDHFDSVEDHPALNFKSNLVRLLGNLCYGNRTAQDRIRELEAMPPLLECCNLDARNPFIQQWSVLAIRNLCAGNPTNQELIASLTRQGVVQPTVLKDLGLVVEENSSGKLRVRTDEDS